MKLSKFPKIDSYLKCGAGALVLAFASFSATAADLIVNGSSIFNELGKQQFVGALYLEAPSNAPDLILYQDRPKRMEVRMLNNYPEHRWFNLWMQSISINNSRDDLAGVANDLIGIIKAPKGSPEAGDVIEFAYMPGEGTSIIYNGNKLATRESKEIFELLLKTWIGPVPPSTDFKSQILGNATNPKATEMLSTIKPSASRVKLAANWIQDSAATVATAANEKSKVVEDEAAKAKTQDSAEQVASAKKAEKLAAAKKNRKAKELAEKKAAEEALAAKAEQEAREQAEALSAMAQLEYTPQVVSKIFKSVSYPRRAAQRNEEGTVRVMLTIDRQGELLNVTPTEESEHSSLNKAAVKAIEKASPFPALPEDFLGDSFEMTVPISFRLQ